VARDGEVSWLWALCSAFPENPVAWNSLTMPVTVAGPHRTYTGFQIPKPVDELKCPEFPEFKLN
jgi:hypothetical protein